MAIPPLTDPSAILLGQASAAALASTFDALRSNFTNSDWLQFANPYRVNCVNQIELDTAAGRGVSPAFLAEYIAASVPLHCSDGWTFLARALSSYCNGNPHQAAHFAYYAELRAAMSILAAQGIGVFNNKHFVIDGAGAVRGPISGRTHTFTWQALDSWAGTSTTGSALLDLLTVSGATVREWFAAVPGVAVAGSLGTDWLRQWGLDLSTVDTDHDMRNLASYRPTEFTDWDTDARGCSEFLRSLWRLFEPAATRFEVLDRHLLRVLVRKTLLSGLDLTNPVDMANAERTLSTMLNGLPIGDNERAAYRDFLISLSPEPSLLRMAETNGGLGGRNVHESVIARAALLLRIASGFTAQLIDGSAFTINDVSFWTNPWGDRRAFWPPNEPPADFSDLWSDIAVAIGEEEDWIANYNSNPISMHFWRRSREETIRSLTECDRASLWALAR